MALTDAALTASTATATLGRQQIRIAGPPVKIGEPSAVRYYCLAAL
jgi:hypothetical protein